MIEGWRHWLFQQLSADPTGDRRLSPLNLVLVVLILAAVAIAILTTEPIIEQHFGWLIRILDVCFAVAFIAEYAARVWSASEASGAGSAVAKRLRFVFSVPGLIDFVVIAITVLSSVVSAVAVLRLARLLRLLTLARLGRFSSAFHALARAIYSRRYELYVTIALASTLLLFGAVALYLVEGDIQPDKFGSIPRALWWSIITLTTVGYGDVSPITPLGKFLAAIVALAGIGLVAMPTGIMAAAFSEAMQHQNRGSEVEPE